MNLRPPKEVRSTLAFGEPSIRTCPIRRLKAGLPSVGHAYIREQPGKHTSYLRGRIRAKTLHCDECGFDPATRVDIQIIRPRSLLDVHHKRPLEEGVRYTTAADFKLLCPTCHRIEHARLKASRRASVPQAAPTQIAAE